MLKHLAVFVPWLSVLTSACNAPRSNGPAAEPFRTASAAAPALPGPAAPSSTEAPPAATAVSATRAASASPATPPVSDHLWTFDSDPLDAAPAGFSLGRTGKGRTGRWLVRGEAGAPSGANVLAQLDADTTDYRFPVAVANEPLLRDVRLSVRCKPVSGRVDQACGLVFRFRDPDNYYVARANALEKNLRLYHVVKGDRQQFAGWNGAVQSGKWHSLQVEAKADHLVVFWDNQKVIDTHDRTFPDAGQLGLWTKADSITYFDNLHAEPL